MVRLALGLALLLVVAATLSGCATKADNETTSSVPSDIQNVQVTQDTGAIRGLVVTASITPIVGAIVKLNGLNQTRTTSDSGSFVFNGLKPGTYFVTASKTGFTTIQTSTQVTAGDDAPPITRIQLAEDLANRPFAELQQWKAFLQCGLWAVAVTTNPCFLTGSDNVHYFAIGGNATPFAQLEAVWEGSQPLGNWLDLSFDGACKGVNSDSPAVVNATAAEIEKCQEKPTNLMVRVFPGATPGTPPTPTVLVNQEYKVYMTYFYGFTPKAGWTFVKDGACDPITVCQ